MPIDRKILGRTNRTTEPSGKLRLLCNGNLISIKKNTIFETFPSSIRLKIEKQICKSAVERPRAWLMSSVYAWNNNAFIRYMKNAGTFMDCALPVIHMKWLLTTRCSRKKKKNWNMWFHRSFAVYKSPLPRTAHTHCHRMTSDKPRLHSNIVGCHFCLVRFHINFSER